MSDKSDRELLSKLIRKRGGLEVRVEIVTGQIVALKKTLGIPLGGDREK